MTVLSRLAADRQGRLVAVSDRTARAVARQFRTVPVDDLDGGWDAIAPTVERVVVDGQVAAAQQATAYVNGLGGGRVEVAAASFGGVTREGRAVVPELYAAVTQVKNLVRRGVGVGRAFEAGAAFMSVMASTLVRDAGRAADQTGAVSAGFTYTVRVVQPGACSRCAILAGVKGYRTDFRRHPGCRCTSMPLKDRDVPEGFFRSPFDYFESLSAVEQERVFTKAGAEAIRLGADPIRVVNARRGAYGIGYSSSRNVPWRPGDPVSRLQPVTIGSRPDGSPLRVYATTEGVTVRGGFGRANGRFVRVAGDRYRRTTMVRLMPEQIMSMSSSPTQAVDLLRKYGYLY